MQKSKPTVLIILDGWGIAPPSKGNAIHLARTPIIDRLSEIYPMTTLGAVGVDVGLEKGHMSGSEAGHMNIGAGRIVQQDSYRISQGIRDGSFYKNPAFLGAIEHVENTGGNFHIMGLMGDSDSPHSSPKHFRALLKLAKENGLKQVYCHLFTDGRDSYPQSAKRHWDHYEDIIQEERIGRIATLSGRYFAMDRAKNWNRMIEAYNAIVFSEGNKTDSPEKEIIKIHKRGLSDEYFPPTIITENGKPIANIGKGDSVVFYNFRSDRARQFTKLFAANNKESIIKDNMPVIDKIENLYFVAMTDFGPDLSINTAFSEHTIPMALPVALRNISQLYIAEMEKYAHLTYFFNGGFPDPVGGEDRITIPSIEVDNYSKTPEMSAGEITENVVKYAKESKFDFIAVNLANADMLGHAGDLKAAVKGIEFIDKQVEKIVRIIFDKGGSVIITADHGNADHMLDRADGKEIIHTFHTKNPVPFILAGDEFKNRKLISGGVLGNVSPTVLDVMNIKKPEEMELNSLLTL